MKLAVLIAVLPSIGLAFTPSVVVPHASTGHVSSRVALAMRKTTATAGRDDKNNASSLLKDSLLRPFGAVLVAASLVFNPGSAVGAGIENTVHGFSVSSPVTSSSLQVAEDIKLLDMSMPSYGTISDPKANTDSVGYVKEDKSVQAAAAAAKKKKAPQAKAKQPSKVAPEKRKPVAKEPFVKEPVVKRDRSDESEEKIDVRSNFKSRPVFIEREEVSVEDKMKEKEERKAERKPAKKEKEAVIVPEEKEDGLSLKDVKIVDMEMPSYGSSTNKKDKSVFAL